MCGQPDNQADAFSILSKLNFEAGGAAMSGHSSEPRAALARIVSEIEETAIAVILGLMTVITFVNVVLRYGFNTGLIWGLEMVTFLFAWLVLFGMSYAVKVTAHLGVDAVTTCLSGAAQGLGADCRCGLRVLCAALV